MRTKIIFGVILALALLLTASIPISAGPPDRTPHIYVGNVTYTINTPQAGMDTVYVSNIIWDNVRPHHIVVYLYSQTDGNTLGQQTSAPGGKDGKYPQYADAYCVVPLGDGYFTYGAMVSVTVVLYDRKGNALTQAVNVISFTWHTANVSWMNTTPIDF